MFLQAISKNFLKIHGHSLEEIACRIILGPSTFQHCLLSWRKLPRCNKDFIQCFINTIHFIHYLISHLIIFSTKDKTSFGRLKLTLDDLNFDLDNRGCDRDGYRNEYFTNFSYQFHHEFWIDFEFQSDLAVSFHNKVQLVLYLKSFLPF